MALWWKPERSARVFLGSFDLDGAFLVSLRVWRWEQRDTRTIWRLTWPLFYEISWLPLSRRCPNTVQALTLSCPTNHDHRLEEIASPANPPAQNLDVVLVGIYYYSIAGKRGKSRWINYGFQISVKVVSSDAAPMLLSRSTVLKFDLRKKARRNSMIQEYSRLE